METTFFVTVLICAAITISVRALPIILLANAQIPALIREWLNFIPAAVMSAIIVAEILAKPALTASRMERLTVGDGNLRYHWCHDAQFVHHRPLRNLGIHDAWLGARLAPDSKIIK